jgi:hypothetical protein
VAEDQALAARFSLPQRQVRAMLDRAEREGWARRRTGRLAGWTLTATGRVEGEARLAAALDESGVRPQVESLYERFLVLNPEVLKVSTAWQVRRRNGVDVPNDHADARHDAAVIDALAAVHDRALPVVEGLSAHVARLGGYGSRLEAALARVMAGDGDWFVRPGIDSYHTVWFELHEDLLATLGRRRADEAS